MPYERTGYAPWSLTREAGVESATVDGTIQVPQYIYPNLDTGFIDEKGVWQGRKSSDRDFIGMTTALAIANGATALFPDSANFNHIDMTGFKHIFIALKPTNAGSYKFEGVMGPDTESFGNLSPVNPASILRMTNGNPSTNSGVFDKALEDAGETLADTWNIFTVYDRLAEQKLLQIKITNNSGGASDLEFAFMRLV